MDPLVAVHVAAAVATAGLALTVTALAALAAIGRSVSRSLVDRSILAVLAAALVATVLGPALLAGGRDLADPLHALYAAIAVMAIPLTRTLAARSGVAAVAGPEGMRSLGRWVTAGGLVTLGALLRLAMTGG